MSTLWSHADSSPLAAEPEAVEVEGDQPDSFPAKRPLIRLDAGWLFLAAGVMLIGATVLIPAQRDLALARWQRDKAAAVERHHQQRLANYGAYLTALEKNDPSVMLSLAGTQLNKSPADRVPLLPPPDPTRLSANIFPSLEPAPLRLLDAPNLDARASTLERWTTDDHVRLWLLAGGVFCLLCGVLPPARK